VVSLGDNLASINLKGKVTLEVEAVSPVSSSGRNIATIDFCVMSMPGMDRIIGLPDILDYFLDIIVDILESGTLQLKGLDKLYCDLESP